MGDITMISDKTENKSPIHGMQIYGRNRLDSYKKKLKTTVVAWLLILPAFTFLSLFTLYPILSSVYSSLFKDDLAVIIPQFIGLKNYVNLLKDEIFIQAFINNLLVAVCTIPTSIALAVCMALFANIVKLGKGLHACILLSYNFAYGGCS